MDTGFCSVVSKPRAWNVYASVFFYIREREAWGAQDYSGTVVGECEAEADLAATAAEYVWAIVGDGEGEGGLETDSHV